MGVEVSLQAARMQVRPGPPWQRCAQGARWASSFRGACAAGPTMRQVSTPGRKAPLMPSSSSSQFWLPSLVTCSRPSAASCRAPQQLSSWLFQHAVQAAQKPQGCHSSQLQHDVLAAGPRNCPTPNVQNHTSLDSCMSRPMAPSSKLARLQCRCQDAQLAGGGPAGVCRCRLDGRP